MRAAAIQFDFGCIDISCFDRIDDINRAVEIIFRKISIENERYNTPTRNGFRKDFKDRLSFTVETGERRITDLILLTAVPCHLTQRTNMGPIIKTKKIMASFDRIPINSVAHGEI
jgi:hypothetical protein